MKIISVPRLRGLIYQPSSLWNLHWKGYSTIDRSDESRSLTGIQLELYTGKLPADASGIRLPVTVVRSDAICSHSFGLTSGFVPVDKSVVEEEEEKSQASLERLSYDRRRRSQLDR